MSRHTPAPWINDRSTRLYDAAEAVAQQFPRGYTDDMVSANLRLMLAAPDMHDVLRDVAALLPCAARLHPQDLAKLQTRVCAALAKVSV
jgi:hypothetical protein